MARLVALGQQCWEFTNRSKEGQTSDRVFCAQGSLFIRATKTIPSGLSQQKLYCDTSPTRLWKECLITNSVSHSAVQLQSVHHQNGHASSGRRSSSLMSHLFFYVTWTAGTCASFTWGSDSTRTHCGTMTNGWRDCDALVNVLLGNPGHSGHSFGCKFDTYLDIVAEQVHPFIIVEFPGGSDRFPTLHTLFRNGVNNM